MAFIIDLTSNPKLTPKERFIECMTFMDRFAQFATAGEQQPKTIEEIEIIWDRLSVMCA